MEDYVLCGDRWYSPDTGRWLSRDPIGYAGGDNLYEYCGDNPIGGIDPGGTGGSAIGMVALEAHQAHPTKPSPAIRTDNRLPQFFGRMRSSGIG